MLDKIHRPDRPDRLGERRPDRLPVHEIFRSPDDNAGAGIERREGHVVAVAVLEDRGIGVIAREDRIQEGSVAEIRDTLILDAAPPVAWRGRAIRWTRCRRGRQTAGRGGSEEERLDGVTAGAQTSSPPGEWGCRIVGRPA